MTKPHAHSPSEVQRDAFAAYGEVMGRVGGVEQTFRLALAQHELERCRRSGKVFDPFQFSAKILRQDFGTLLQQVADKFGFIAGLRGALKDAKGLRNYLAHDFWPVHFTHLRTEDGCAMIKRECRLYGRQFDLAAEALIQATGVSLSDYTQFLDHNAQSPLPTEWSEKLQVVEDAMAAVEQVAYTQGPSVPLTNK